MKLLIIGHKYQYEMLKLTQIFYPNTKIDLLFSSADTGDDETVITTELTKDNITVSFAEQKKQKVLTKPRPEKENEERCMASMLFSLLCENTGYIPKWGMLTGIRPSKLFRGFAERYGEEKAKKIFTDDYFVSKQKTGLTASVASAEEKQSLCRAPILSAFTSQYRSARRGAVTAHLYRIQRKQRVQRKQFPSMLSSYVRSFA